MLLVVFVLGITARIVLSFSLSVGAHVLCRCWGPPTFESRQRRERLRRAGVSLLLILREKTYPRRRR